MNMASHEQLAAPAMQQPIAISDQEFVQFQRFIHDAAGISLSAAKKALVSGRLARRLQHCQLHSYGDYFRLLASGHAAAEVQAAIDLLTTNETYFFREPKHFDMLREYVRTVHQPGQMLRVWSAASSSGEEAYSIAMVLADCLHEAPWEVVGSDISMRVLERARLGHYPLERTTHMPPAYLKRFCLKGTGQQQGTLLIDRRLRQRVCFMQVNLNVPLPALGAFDLIFLRNVMIYFDARTKQQVVARVIGLLKPHGRFVIGHAESLHGVTDLVRALGPSIYSRDAAM
ncbi:CheR family methyltransferase [Massilia sp. PWRC2]|uniref:CheR family methyltransferase n=1 Tax=Massilia sp. PWRC2 TaxID=2804626 RepID=UPI003CF33CFD